MERAVAGVYLQAVLSDILIVTVQQKVYFLSCMSQFCSIKSANGTCADDSVSHIDKFILKMRRQRYNIFGNSIAFS
jgi:hypothetical protein